MPINRRIILKNQIKMLSTKKVYDLLKKINLLELKIKKNLNLSNFLLDDFLIQKYWIISNFFLQFLLIYLVDQDPYKKILSNHDFFYYY